MPENPLLSVLAYSSLPVASAIMGGVISTFRPPGPKLKSAIQHFAAGVVFSVVAVELLPDVIRQHKPVQVIIGFAFGVVAMLAIRSLTGNTEEESPEKAAEAGSRLPVPMLVAVAVDVLIDGFLIGIGFAAGAREGKLLTLALTIELLSLGLAVSCTLIYARVPRAKAIVTIAVISLLIVVGAAGGATLLSGLSDTALEIVLSFGLAALLFLVTEELLVEAHEVPETHTATATFFMGFLIFLVLGMLN